MRLFVKLTRKDQELTIPMANVWAITKAKINGSVNESAGHELVQGTGVDREQMLYDLFMLKYWKSLST